ncbi:MAG: enoyl-CoA hydratase/isomerase family protein [Myxococcota bacterium]
MSEELILRERHGAVEVLKLNRPKALNALNPALLGALSQALEQIDTDDSVRAVVLTGEGRAFVAGADISAMRTFSAVEAERFAGRGQAIIDRISTIGVPVIAAVNGFALGGGCELAMACDIVLAGEKALFGQPEVKLGVIPGFGGTQRLVRRVGLAVAMDLCLTGRNIKADEAVQIGLASRKVEGDVLEGAIEVAQGIAGLGPVAVRLCKRVMHENADADLSTGIAAERSLFGLCFATEDQTEGMTAFIEKRAADFTGR